MVFCIENNIPYNKVSKLNDLLKELMVKENIEIMKKVYIERDYLS